MEGPGFVSGLDDCHVPGVYSLVLQERRDALDGMLRIFYVSREASIDRLEQDGDFAVMPHNHRQDVTLYKLFGSAKNARLSLVGGHDHVQEYVFGSKLLTGEFSLSWTRTVWTGQFSFEPIHPDGVHLAWSDVHTVVADVESAWLVKEGATAPEPYTSLCYSRRLNRQLCQDGLYRTLERKELDEIRDRIVRATA
jgi:hypothetical protein